MKKSKVDKILATLTPQDYFNIKDYALTLLWQSKGWQDKDVAEVWVESVLKFLQDKDLLK